jgi:hypothetical protein
MARSLLVPLLIALVALPSTSGAAECPDPARFQAEVLEVVRRAFPGQTAHPAPDHAIEAGGFVFGLENLRKLACAPPRTDREERAQLIREHFREGFRFADDVRGGKRLDWSAAREHVVVQLLTEDLAARLNVLRRPLVQGVAVVVVLDLPTAYAYLGAEQPARWGVSREELFARAIDNLARRTRGEMRSSGDGVDRVLFVGEQDGYDAARILTPSLRKAAAGLLGDPFRASIPNRDFLVMWARGNTQLAMQAAPNARRDFESQPHPISPLVLEVWADGRIAAVPSSADRR